MSESWTTLIPAVLGALPLDGQLTRTDHTGPQSAKIAFLGVYPAVTKMAQWEYKGEKRNLPVEVERTSFQPESKSGEEIDKSYLKPLDLTRAAVLVFDMMPYYFASTSATGKKGRSMWENIQQYAKVKAATLAVEARPSPDDLIAKCHTMPGNLERLRWILDSAPALRLLFTLGNEPAAFLRRMAHADAAQKHLYGLDEVLPVDVLGRSVRVVHLAHPGILMKSKKWQDRHEAWCKETGRSLVARLQEQ